VLIGFAVFLFDSNLPFPGLAALVPCLGTGILLFDESEGLPDAVAGILKAADDKPRNRGRCEGVVPGEVNLDRLCKITAIDIAPTFILWGDSHANMLVPAISPIVENKRFNGVLAVANGCAPLLGVQRTVTDVEHSCLSFNEAVFDLIRTQPQIETVILAARWGLHSNGVAFGDDTGVTQFLSSSNAKASNQSQNQTLFTSAFTKTLAELKKLQRRVVVVGPVPEVAQDVPTVLAKAKWRGRDLSLQVQTRDFLARQATFLDALGHASSAVDYLPLHDRLCDEYQCTLAKNGLPLYFDENHLASSGIEMVRPAFA